jgi:uncharacterized membrane protein YoaK (UPF0700 family)
MNDPRTSLSGLITALLIIAVAIAGHFGVHISPDVQQALYIVFLTVGLTLVGHFAKDRPMPPPPAVHAT